MIIWSDAEHKAWDSCTVIHLGGRRYYLLGCVKSHFVLTHPVIIPDSFPHPWVRLGHVSLGVWMTQVGHILMSQADSYSTFWPYSRFSENTDIHKLFLIAWFAPSFFFFWRRRRNENKKKLRRELGVWCCAQHAFHFPWTWLMFLFCVSNSLPFFKNVFTIHNALISLFTFHKLSVCSGLFILLDTYSGFWKMSCRKRYWKRPLWRGLFNPYPEGHSATVHAVQCHSNTKKGDACMLNPFVVENRKVEG